MFSADHWPILSSNRAASRPSFVRAYSTRGGTVGYTVRLIKPSHSRVRSVDQLTELVEAGKLRVFVDQVLPLEQAAEAHELSETRRVSGKIVLKVR
jgi:NADPH:quinone reductase-like Zn-dependent oxidoreductase